MLDFLNYQFPGGLRVLHFILIGSFVVILALDWGERKKIREQRRREKELEQRNQFGRP